MSKYKNRKVNGYDSAKEAKRAAELKLLERAGEISNLEEQVRFELVPKQEGLRAAHYVCDFSYIQNKKLVVEDVKSEFTRKLPVYILKKKLMRFVHDVEILET